MWRSRTLLQPPPQPPEVTQQISTSVINATPLTVIQPSGLNGKTANLAKTTQTTVGPKGTTEECPQPQTGPLKRALCRRGGNRLVHPRLSLWGKPMNTRQRHRDPRYRKLRFQVNNFLERPRGWKAIGYHMIV